MKPILRHLVLVTLCAAAVTVLVAAPAAATPGYGSLEREVINHERCVYRQGGPSGPKGNTLVVVSYQPIHIGRRGKRLDVYLSGGGRCQGPRPTVDNVDEIVIKGGFNEGVRIDERNGRFAPGASGAGIRFRVYGPRLTLRGTNGRDHILVGTSKGRTAIASDAGTGRPHYDVPMMAGRPELVAVAGGPGDDLLDARRLRGMSKHRDRHHRLKLNGGGGDDTVLGNPGCDWRLVDGPGDDVVRSEGGNDSIWFETGRDTLIGGGGNDEIAYMTYEGFTYQPPDPSDRIFAGPGQDLLRDINRHSDLLDCGAGLDRVAREPHDRPQSNCERNW
jgi:hypothetical protein